MLHRALRMTRVSNSTYASYCDSRNKAIFQTKRAYYEQRLSCCSNEAKETWKQRNNLLETNKPEKELRLYYNDPMLNNPADID